MWSKLVHSDTSVHDLEFINIKCVTYPRPIPMPSNVAFKLLYKNRHDEVTSSFMSASIQARIQCIFPQIDGNLLVLSKEFKKENRSLFDSCVNTMGQEPFCLPGMEMRYCASGYGGNPWNHLV